MCRRQKIGGVEEIGQGQREGKKGTGRKEMVVGKKETMQRKGEKVADWKKGRKEEKVVYRRGQKGEG